MKLILTLSLSTILLSSSVTAQDLNANLEMPKFHDVSAPFTMSVEAPHGTLVALLFSPYLELPGIETPWGNLAMRPPFAGWALIRQHGERMTLGCDVGPEFVGLKIFGQFIAVHEATMIGTTSNVACTDFIDAALAQKPQDFIDKMPTP